MQLSASCTGLTGHQSIRWVHTPPGDVLGSAVRPRSDHATGQQGRRRLGTTHGDCLVVQVFVCAIAGAYAQAVEHRIMLGVLGVVWPPAGEEEDIENEEEEEEEDEDNPEPKYCPLGAARIAAGGLKSISNH